MTRQPLSSAFTIRKEDLLSHADTCGSRSLKHVLYFHERIQTFFVCLLCSMFHAMQQFFCI